MNKLLLALTLMTFTVPFTYADNHKHDGKECTCSKEKKEKDCACENKECKDCHGEGKTCEKKEDGKTEDKAEEKKAE